MKLGTIKSVDSTYGVTILFDGEEEPTTKKYKHLKSYLPSVNDRVVVEECGGSYIVLGSIKI